MRTPGIFSIFPDMFRVRTDRRIAEVFGLRKIRADSQSNISERYPSGNGDNDFRLLADNEADGIHFEILDADQKTVTILANGRLVFARDKAASLAEFANFVAGSALAFDWGDGKVNNAGECIQLSLPRDVNSDNEWQCIRVGRVNYNDQGLWTTEADGGVDLDENRIMTENEYRSMHRIIDRDYGTM